MVPPAVSWPPVASWAFPRPSRQSLTGMDGGQAGVDDSSIETLPMIMAFVTLTAEADWHVLNTWKSMFSSKGGCKPGSDVGSLFKSQCLTEIGEF